MPDGNGADWRTMITRGLSSAEDVAKRIGGDLSALKGAEEALPVRVNEYYLSLIQSPDDPIGRQVIPQALETAGAGGNADPLAEDEDTPVPHLVHRYPDRVLLLVTYQCAVYCRFCTRRRAVGRYPTPTEAEMEKALAWIGRHREIRDVIISGGDPFMLSDTKLLELVGRVRRIPHVEIIRVDTRTPCSLPARVTDELCRGLAKFHPLFVNTHFNHPREVTPEAKTACERLADAGIPVGNQTVLLRGVNDEPGVIRELCLKLLAARVRPYYLYQCDPVAGAEHFRTDVRKGLEIISQMRGHVSGLAIPSFVIDAPGGGGKVPALPADVLEINGDKVVVRNYEGGVFEYPQPRGAIK